MYINRIILRDALVFDDLDITLHNDWTGDPLRSVLLTGPNGSGKTTLLRIIAALWENFGEWLRLHKTLNAEQQAQNGLLTDIGLAAIEVHQFQQEPLWLFTAATPDDYSYFKDTAYLNTLTFTGQVVGEVRGRQGRPSLEGGQNDWFDSINSQKERLELGVDDAAVLPNAVFLRAEQRNILAPNRNRTVYTEALYRWLVSYDAQQRWQGHLEAMLRNLKVRDPQAFRQTLDQINAVIGGDKRLTDFDDNLRLRVVVDGTRNTSHTIDQLSSGEQQVLLLLFMVSRWMMPGGLVLIDEPDLHLHVSLQRQVVHQLEQLVRAKEGQLIVTSHSPTLWDEYTERQRMDLGQTANEQS